MIEDEIYFGEIAGLEELVNELRSENADLTYRMLRAKESIRKLDFKHTRYCNIYYDQEECNCCKPDNEEHANRAIEDLTHGRT